MGTTFQKEPLNEQPFREKKFLSSQKNTKKIITKKHLTI